MKYFFDNNLSPALAKAIAALCEPEGILVQHIRDKFAQNTPDLEWISTLAAERDWAVITQDRLIKNSFEKEALRVSGLTAFILAKAWGNQRQWEKAAQLVKWWPSIMAQSGLVEGGAVFGVPWKLSGKGKFKPLRL